MNAQDKDILLEKINQIRQFNNSLYDSVDNDLVHYCAAVQERLDLMVHYIVAKHPKKRKKVAK